MSFLWQIDDRTTTRPSLFVRAGAPVDYIFPEPFVPVLWIFLPSSCDVVPTASSACRRSLVDFMLSKHGQEIAFNTYPLAGVKISP